MYDLFNDAVSSSDYSLEWQDDSWLGKDMEGSGRSIIPTFARSDWGKARKTSVSIAGIGADIWNRNLPSTKQEC
jgi:hypothetical protein